MKIDCCYFVVEQSFLGAIDLVSRMPDYQLVAFGPSYPAGDEYLAVFPRRALVDIARMVLEKSTDCDLTRGALVVLQRLAVELSCLVHSA